MTVGLNEGARGVHQDSMLICVRDQAGCYQAPLPSRAAAFTLTEALSRAIRTEDEERRADAH